MEAFKRKSCIYNSMEQLARVILPNKVRITTQGIKDIVKTLYQYQESLLSLIDRINAY